ncbi:hypothetical protein BGZ54_007363, partial [Gamsiella multidivaricata]
TQLSEKMRRVDYLGVLFIVAAVLCLLLPLSWGGTTYAWNSAPIIILFCLFAVLLVVVYFIELRAGKDAVIPPALFLNRNVALAVLINGLMGMCYMGCTYYMPLYFQAVQGTSTTNSGLRMMPSTFAIVFSTITASFLLKRVRDYRVFLWVGTAIMTLGVGLFMLLDAEAGLGKQLGFVLIMGLGQGLIFQNCLLTCQECAGDEYIAVATALCGFINSVGSAVGVAICGSAFNNALVKNVAKLSPEIQEIVREYGVIENMDAISKLPGDEIRRQVVQTYADSFRFLFMVLTPIMGASFIMSLFLNKRRPAPAATEKET